MTSALQYRTRNALRRLGVELVRAGQADASLLGVHLDRLFRDRRIDVVLDVGAKAGEYGAWLRGNGYAGRIVSFEPVSTSFAELAERAHLDDAWDVHQLALGSASATAEIAVARLPQLSSFRTRNAFSQAGFADAMDVQRVEQVPVRRLDALWDDVVPAGAAAVYLKVDTQGWDLEVLAGLGARAAEVVALQTEMAVQPIYEGSPTLRESLDAVTALGFTPSGMFPVTLDAALALVELDCVAVRTDSATTRS